MNNDNTDKTHSPVVTFSNIPLDDPPAAPAPEPPKEITVADIQFKKGGKVYYFSPGGLTLSKGDEVIIDTARGPEYGFCARGNHAVPQEEAVQPLRRVLRVATERDRQNRAHYQAKEAEAFSQCQKKITEHGLDMKLVSAEYNFDGSRILFYFTADGRVDFRDLVKDLAGIFHTRIELRQIGVRDEAKLLGGLGICGRPFCCKQFLDDFQPVSIKMAKTQGLSLNPTKISGTCGRLMCCLKYEQEAYEDLIRTSPKNDSIVNTYDGVGTVTDLNLLQQTVKVRLESDPKTTKCYHNCEVCVLRSGKGKKGDPPVDTNIPPLEKPQAAEPEPIAMFDESALSRYLSQRPELQTEPRRSRKSRPSRDAKKPKQAAPKDSQKPSPKEGQKPAQSAAPKKSRNHRKRRSGKRPGGQKPES